MPSLFIANTTKQDHTFYYRIKLPNHRTTDEGKIQTHSNDLRQQSIPAGTQIRLQNRDMSEADVKGILEQHERHLIEVKSLKRVRGFVGLSYSVGDPVPLDEMLARFEQNDKVKEAEATTRLQQTATAIADRMRKVNPNAPLATASVEVVEEASSANNNSPSIALGVEVPSEGIEPRARRRA